MNTIFHSSKGNSDKMTEMECKKTELACPDVVDIDALYGYIEQLENTILQRLTHEYDENISMFVEEEMKMATQNTVVPSHSLEHNEGEPTLEDIFDEDFLLELEEEIYKQIDEYEIQSVFYIDTPLKNKITNDVLENILLSLDLICDEEIQATNINPQPQTQTQPQPQTQPQIQPQTQPQPQPQTQPQILYSNVYDLESLNVEQLHTFIKERVDIYFDHIFTDSTHPHDPRPRILPRSIQIDVFDGRHAPRDNEEMQTIDSKIERLRKQHQPQQRTDEWYNLRNQIMTASNIHKIFGSQAQYNSFICEKCAPVVKQETQHINTNDTRHWGQKYEKLTLLIYESMYNVRVGEFGCIRHPQYEYIGASPDGIVTGDDPLHPHYGRMVEIKNIVNREITGDPLEAYWVQMQIQMEVCDLDVCNFIETRFKECETADEWKLINKKKGVVVSNIPIEFTNEYIPAPEYEFVIYDENTPLPVFIEKWISKNTVVKWWYMMEFSCVVVPRNRAWFASVLPKLTDAWNTILKERENGEYKKRLPKKKTPKCLIASLFTENDGEGCENVKHFYVGNNSIELDKNTVVIKDSSN
jgi:putative phage-type endonuclease